MSDVEELYYSIREECEKDPVKMYKEVCLRIKQKAKSLDFELVQNLHELKHILEIGFASKFMTEAGYVYDEKEKIWEKAGT